MKAVTTRICRACEGHNRDCRYCAGTGRRPSMLGIKPFRVPPRRRLPPTDVQAARIAARAESTRLVSQALQRDVLAMDTLPEQGVISFRDTAGKVWVISIEASDVNTLISETAKGST